ASLASFLGTFSAAVYPKLFSAASSQLGHRLYTQEGGQRGARRGGFKTVYSLSPLLQVIVVEPEMARPEVVKKLWAYIREKDLQDPKNRWNIRCDESLHAVFRVKSVDMFKMNKVLSKHIWPLNREDVMSRILYPDLLVHSHIPCIF
ncbi:hypothetical protein ABKV19_005625, partial [Rosa sericea]